MDKQLLQASRSIMEHEDFKHVDYRMKRWMKIDGNLGGISKSILLLTASIWGFLIFEFIEINQIEIAMVLLIGLTISISITAFECWKNRKKKETRTHRDSSSFNFATLQKNQ